MLQAFLSRQPTYQNRTLTNLGIPPSLNAVLEKTLRLRRARLYTLCGLRDNLRMLLGDNANSSHVPYV